MQMHWDIDCTSRASLVNMKAGLLKIINDVNGHIRNSNRLVILNKICIKYDLNLIYPDKLTYDSGWLAGFFDGDGTVTINKSTTQLSISASQKTSELLTPPPTGGWLIFMVVMSILIEVVINLSNGISLKERIF